MDNMYQPPTGDSQDNWPTQQFGPAEPSGTGAAAGQAWPGWSAQPARPQAPARSGHRALRWSAGIAAAALLAGGAVVVASSSAPAAGPTGQAAVLNGILSSASAPVASAAATDATALTPATAGSSAASGTAAAATAASGAVPAGTAPAGTAAGAGSAANGPAAGRCLRAAARLLASGHPRAARIVARLCRHRRPLLRAAALGGMHGQFTFQAKAGPRTIAFTRGVVESVTGSDIVVRAADATTWTWDLVSNTVVREHGSKVATSALSSGEQIFVGGQVVSGASDARLIVIRPPAAAQSSG